MCTQTACDGGGGIGLRGLAFQQLKFSKSLRSNSLSSNDSELREARMDWNDISFLYIHMYILTSDTRVVDSIFIGHHGFADSQIFKAARQIHLQS